MNEKKKKNNISVIEMKKKIVLVVNIYCFLIEIGFFELRLISVI